MSVCTPLPRRPWCLDSRVPGTPTALRSNNRGTSKSYFGHGSTTPQPCWCPRPSLWISGHHHPAGKLFYTSGCGCCRLFAWWFIQRCGFSLLDALRLSQLSRQLNSSRLVILPRDFEEVAFGSSPMLVVCQPSLLPDSRLLSRQSEKNDERDGSNNPTTATTTGSLVEDTSSISPPPCSLTSP